MGESNFLEQIIFFYAVHIAQAHYMYLTRYPLSLAVHRKRNCLYKEVVLVEVEKVTLRILVKSRILGFMID
jgi:hypothetical protein